MLRIIYRSRAVVSQHTLQAALRHVCHSGHPAWDFSTDCSLGLLPERTHAASDSAEGSKAPLAIQMQLRMMHMQAPQQPAADSNHSTVSRRCSAANNAAADAVRHSRTEARPQPQQSAPAKPGAHSPPPPAADADAAPASEPSAASAARSPVFEYHAPLSDTVRRLKKLSLFGCSATLIAAPLLVALDPTTATSVGARVAIGGMMAGFGTFTTGLLHWFVSPYVHHLRYDRTTGLVEATRLNLFARPVTTRFRVGDAEYADTMRPQVTFKAHGKYYYLDADHLGDPELYDQLNIPDPNDPAAQPQGDK